jgi:hypothetical protein
MAADAQPIRNNIIYTLGALGGLGTLIVSAQNEYEPAYVVMNVALSALLWMGIGAGIGWGVDRARGAQPQPSSRPAEARALASPTRPSAPVTAMAPQSQSSDTTALADSLRQLKALHDEGILTDSEYEAKRQVLAAKL